MDANELDTALEELEQRLERLRALYQQYFLGIEKIEPAVARKDVERRIWLLRREQIRNTGKRFKLNVLVQRYNTFQQYWTRICREIENGTYSRHLQRAQRTIDDDKLLTIAARRRGAKRRRQDEPQDEEQAAAMAAAARQSLEQDLVARLEEGLDPMDEIRRAMDEALGTSGPPGPGATLGAEQAPIPRAPPVVRPGGGISPFDLELADGPEPALHRPPSQGIQEAEEVASYTPTMVEEVSVAPQTAERRSPPRPAGAPKAGRPAASSGQSLPGQARQASGGQGPLPGARPAAGAPRPARAAEPGQSSLDARRLKELHTRLLEAKRSTGDLGTVTEEGLARSLRAAETKLREKHGSRRRVDFDIVIKNGKAVVKPIVR